MREFDGRSHYPIDLDQLPSNWTTGWVREICASIHSGFASGEHNSDGQGIPHLRPMNINRKGCLDLAEVKYVSPDQDSRRLARGDVLFNNTNSPVLIGKTCPILTDADFAFSNHMTRLRPRAGVDVRFLAHELHYLWMAGFFLHKCVKHVNQASVSADVLGSTIPVAVAPSGEQRRIVEAIESYFTRLDDATAMLERVQRNLKRYRASVLKAAVEGRLVPTEAELARAEGRDYEPAPVLLDRILVERRRRWREAGRRGEYQEPMSPDTSDLPELPEGWCWAAWSQIGLSQNGRAFPSKEYQEAGVRLLRPGNLHVTGKVDWTPKNTQYMPEKWATDFPGFVVGPGELVMNLTAQSLADEFLGRICLTGAGERCLLNQRIARLTPIFVDAPLLLWFFKASVFRRFVDSLNTGSLIEHMFTSQLARFVLPLPPAAEQVRIAAEVERHMTLADGIDTDIEHDLGRCARLRQAILKWAFEGKLVDQDLNDEPASVLLERIRTERASRMSIAATGAPQKRRGQGVQ